MAFLHAHALRFDARYNRQGASASDFGGGEDVVMLRRLLALGARIRWRPDMRVRHAVEPWRLRRSYLLRLHYLAGVRKGLHELPEFPESAAKGLPVPPFLLRQALGQSWRWLALRAAGHPQALRQAMNATHAFGLIRGLLMRGPLMRDRPRP